MHGSRIFWTEREDPERNRSNTEQSTLRSVLCLQPIGIDTSEP